MKIGVGRTAILVVAEIGNVNSHQVLVSDLSWSLVQKGFSYPNISTLSAYNNDPTMQ